MKKIILTKIGSRILVGSVLSAGVAGALWTIADLRIFGMTTKKTQAQGYVEKSLVNSMTDYQRLRALRAVADSQLAPDQVTENEVLAALAITTNGDVQNVLNLDHRPKISWIDRTRNWIDSRLNPKKVQQRLDASVNSVAWSPDGQTLASGSDDNTVKLWRRDGTLISTLKGHEASVLSVAWSPDGQTLASGSDDKTVKLWRRNGTLTSTLKGHASFIFSVAWSPDGQTLASGSDDKTVKLWRRGGTLISTLKGHESSVSSLAWSADGQTLASGSYDSTVKLWETLQWDERSQFALGCYWLKDMMNQPEIQGLKNDCKNAKSDIPKLLIPQARATAMLGNFESAKKLLEEAKQGDASLSIDEPLANARKIAGQSLLWKAEDRITTSQKAINKGDRTAYLEEANFLVRRAKNINPELDLDRELKQIKERWEKSVKKQ